MHKKAIGHSREEIVEQVKNEDSSIKDFTSYVPIGNANQKLQTWKEQGAIIIYLTSRRSPEEIKAIRAVLQRYTFPGGEFVFRRADERYEDVVERVLPDILIEDNCESIGGEKEMVYPHLESELKGKIKSIVIKEFGGIDHLLNRVSDLLKN